MRDEKLLNELLHADTEADVLKGLNSRGLLKPENFKKHWRYVGDLPNNQAIVLTQQSWPVRRS